MQIITTIDDLRTYIDNAFDLSVDDAEIVADHFSRQAATRPDYGTDWADYLESIDFEQVHEILENHEHEQEVEAAAREADDREWRRDR